MSKKLWIPPTKADRPDQPLRPLPKVRISGMNSRSPLGQRLLERYAGRIGQFHMAQAHNYSLAPQDIFRGNSNSDDIRLRYTNMHGQEIIEIYVNPSIIEEEKEVKQKYWDWAVIDFNFPVAEQVARFSAFMTMPRQEEITVTTVEPVRGVAREGASWTLLPPEPLVAFPDPDRDYIDSIATTDTVASLRVDLRQFHGLTAVTIDVYGFFDPHVEEVGTIVGRRFLVSKGRPTVSEEAHEVFAANIGSYGEAVLLYPELIGLPVNIPFPFVGELQFDFDSTWNGSNWTGGIDPNVIGATFGATGSVSHIEDGDLTYFPGTSIVATNTEDYCTWNPPSDLIQRPMPVGTPPPNGNGLYNFNWGDFTNYYGPSGSTEYVTTYPDRIGTVSGVLSMGWPDFAHTAESNEEQDHLRWQDVSRYPDRWGLADLGPVTAISMDYPSDDALSNHFGMPLLGTITIDLIHGGISWAAVT